MNTTEINTSEIQTAELNTTETNNYTECYYVYSNETLFVCTLTSSAGAGLTSFLQKVEQRRRVFSVQYMYRITLQYALLSNTDKYSFRHSEYGPHFM